MQAKILDKKLLSLFLAFIIAGTAGNVAAKEPGKKPAAATTEKAAATTEKEDPAITRTRQQVKMLDDLYKTAVVLITEHYVTDPSILSAASASKALFAAMKKNGWHEARLIGYTDVIYNSAENLPQDAFEKKAKEELLAGKSTHEEVVTKNGKRFLRVATPVPVVMERCVMCHANFKGNKGAIGSLSYTVPVIE